MTCSVTRTQDTLQNEIKTKLQQKLKIFGKLHTVCHYSTKQPRSLGYPADKGRPQKKNRRGEQKILRTSWKSKVWSPGV